MRQNIRRHITLFTLIFLAAFACLTTSAAAEEDNSTIRIAVLDVPDGGTDLLAENIAAIDNVEVERQGWFLEQITERGFSAQGIMTRTEDLKWLMQGSDLHYVLYLAPSANDSLYSARLVSDEAGEVAFEFEAERSENGISRSASQLAAGEVSDFLERQESARSEQDAAERAQVEREAAENRINKVREQESAERERARVSFSRDWLKIGARGLGLRRDLSVTGQNKGVMAYDSSLYAGFGLSAEAFPIGMSNEELAGIGFYLDYVQGFDSVIVLDTESNETPVSILHLELEGGMLYQIGDPLRLRATDEARVSLSIGVRHTNLGADANPMLPSLSHTSFLVGARVNRNLFSESFELNAGFAVAPFGIYGTGAELFGVSSFTHGASGDLGVALNVSDAIAITAGYEMRLQYTSFTGSGDLDFEEANSIELVQGFSAGLRYQY